MSECGVACRDRLRQFAPRVVSPQCSATPCRATRCHECSAKPTSPHLAVAQRTAMCCAIKPLLTTQHIALTPNSSLGSELHGTFLPCSESGALAPRYGAPPSHSTSHARENARSGPTAKASVYMICASFRHCCSCVVCLFR